MIKILLGIDLFNSSCFQTTIAFPSFYRAELSNSVVDEIYIDEDTTITDSVIKPTVWGFKTILDAPFTDDSLEGGSISSGNGLVIDHILFQKRKSDELYWSDVSQITFDGTSIFYETIDKYVANDFDYEYSLIPLVNTVQGNRIVSPTITVDFNGVFLSDKENNYFLYYDLEYGEIQHNTPKSVQEPLNSQFPIISYSQLDYKTLNVRSTSISDATASSGGTIDIKQEKIRRQQLFTFLKNKKPKIYRDSNGNVLLVSITDNPKEEPQSSIIGLSKVSFSMTEIGDAENNDSLIEMDLLEGITSV